MLGYDKPKPWTHGPFEVRGHEVYLDGKRVATYTKPVTVEHLERLKVFLAKEAGYEDLA